MRLALRSCGLCDAERDLLATAEFLVGVKYRCVKYAAVYWDHSSRKRMQQSKKNIKKSRFLDFEKKLQKT